MFKVTKKQPFNYFFSTYSIFYLQQTHSSAHSEDQRIEEGTLCSPYKHKGNLFFTKENVCTLGKAKQNEAKWEIQL